MLVNSGVGPPRIGAPGRSALPFQIYDIPTKCRLLLSDSRPIALSEVLNCLAVFSDLMSVVSPACRRVKLGSRAPSPTA